MNRELIHSQRPLMGRHLNRDDLERGVDSVDSGAVTTNTGEETETAIIPVELPVGQ
jgi:hypothetical protein